jgi:hypothetical protein
VRREINSGVHETPETSPRLALINAGTDDGSSGALHQDLLFTPVPNCDPDYSVSFILFYPTAGLSGAGTNGAAGLHPRIHCGQMATVQAHFAPGPGWYSVPVCAAAHRSDYRSGVLPWQARSCVRAGSDSCHPPAAQVCPMSGVPLKMF